MQLTEAMLSMVEAGIGIAVLARWAVVPYPESRKAKAIPLQRPGLRREWKAVALKSPSTPDYFGEFIEGLARHGPAERPSDRKAFQPGRYIISDGARSPRAPRNPSYFLG